MSDTNGNNFHHDERRTYLIRYFLVWCTSRRKEVLVEGTAEIVRQLITEECDIREWQIINLDIRPDHVRILVSVMPSIAAEKAVKALKDATAHLNEELGLKLPGMWTLKYFATTGIPSEIAVQKFLARQSSRKRRSKLR